MKSTVSRSITIGVIILATIIGVGCVSVPQREFQSYNWWQLKKRCVMY